jgi:anti-anti-sigma regulatory factor
MDAERPRPIVCDVAPLTVDAETVDTLARLKLTTLRMGVELQLRGVSPELRSLLELCGLSGVLGVLHVEVGGQPEEREQRRGVEEELHARDPSVTDLDHL